MAATPRLLATGAGAASLLACATALSAATLESGQGSFSVNRGDGFVPATGKTDL